MLGHPTPIGDYQDIQDQSDGNDLHYQPGIIDFIYHSWNIVESCYLLCLPHAPVMTWRSVIETDRSETLLDDQNFSVSQYIKRVYVNQKWQQHQERLLWQQVHPHTRPFPEPQVVDKSNAAFVDEWEVEDHVIVPEDYDNINKPEFDLQQLDWYERIGITPQAARSSRDELYLCYRNLRDDEALVCSAITYSELMQADTLQDYSPCTESMTGARFLPQAMHSKHRAATPHFELRNHFAVQDHLRYIYSDGSQVWSEYNWSSQRINIMDFSDVTKYDMFLEPVSISTLALSMDHPRSICMVGGLNGEFAYKSLIGDNDMLMTNPIRTGLVTTHNSAVINHIDIQNRCAVISCNDNKIRTLDLETGNFLNYPSKPRTGNGTEAGHTYDFAINCTATCPDGRLRVAVGDEKEGLIINADNGEIEHELKGHSDYSFACAWSPDARYVATAAQDRLVNIYDTRTWRILSTFSSHVSTHRSMKFSPVGGGTACLLLAEEADRVTIVNARTFKDAQTLSFYGSIVGADFERDGAAFWVANSDEKFGGFMRYQRTGQGQQYGLSFPKQADIGEACDRFEEEGPNEWILDEDRVRDSRCVNPNRHGEKWELGFGNLVV